MSKNQLSPRDRWFPAVRLATDGVLIAVYFVLSYYLQHLEFSGVRLSFVGLPLLLCAVLFGPLDAVLVAFLGEFLAQMVAWGFTPTSLVWCAPETIRALLLGLACTIFADRLTADRLGRGKSLPLYFAVGIAAALVTSCANTAAYYVDSKLYGYYTFELLFGVLWIRLAAGAVIAVLMAGVSVPLFAALNKAGIFSRRGRGR